LDFEQRSLGQLKLARQYRSRSQGNNAMGKKWEFSLDAPRINSAVIQCLRSSCRPYVAIVTEVDGTQNVLYYTQGDAYRLAKNNFSMLVEYSTSTGRWTLWRNGNRYDYTGAGRVLSVTTDSLETSLTYNQPGDELLAVTNGLGQSVKFTYDDRRIATVTDPSGSVWRYEYNANGMLFRVTSPGSNAYIKTYHYEDANDATLLTGVSINSERRTIYSYYLDKRVKESGTFDGVERDRFTYAANSTTMTDARGLSSTFTFTAVAGEQRLATISRANAINCPQASATTEYDANGYISKKMDWNGVTSTWSYNASGLLLSRVQGANSANPLIETYEYTQFNKLSSQTQLDSSGVPFRKLTYVYYPGVNGRIATETESDLINGSNRSVSYTYTYFANGALATETRSRSLPAGGSATEATTYDSVGNITKKINAAGHLDTFSNHDGLGRVGRIVDANGIVLDQTWNPDGTIRTSTRYTTAGAKVASYYYDGEMNLLEARLPSGQTIRFKYNAAGQVNGVGDGIGQYLDVYTDLVTNTDQLRSSRQVAALVGSVPIPIASGEFVKTIQRDALRRPWRQVGSGG